MPDTTKEELSEMMVGRKINFTVEKKPCNPGKVVLDVNHISIDKKVSGKKAVNNVSFKVREGEIVCIAGIDGNGQSELVYGLTGLTPLNEGKITLCGKDITQESIRKRNLAGLAHIPEDRHKYGLVLDYTLAQNLVLKSYFKQGFQRLGFINFKKVEDYAQHLIKQYDVRSGQGTKTVARSMSGGNQQKAIIAREIGDDPELLIAVQPTRGLDVGAIEYIHKQLIAQRDNGKAVLLISLELDEVLKVSDRILVIYEGELVADIDPKNADINQLGLYMAGSKRDEVAYE